jgi:hypothetical protein
MLGCDSGGLAFFLDVADVLGVFIGDRCPFQRQINHKSSSLFLLAFHFDPPP